MHMRLTTERLGVVRRRYGYTTVSCPEYDNVADWPSRGVTAYLTSVLRSSAVDVVMPPVDSWVSTEAALAYAVARPHPTPRHQRGGKRARRSRGAPDEAASS